MMFFTEPNCFPNWRVIGDIEMSINPFNSKLVHVTMGRFELTLNQTKFTVVPTER